MVPNYSIFLAKRSKSWLWSYCETMVTIYGSVQLYQPLALSNAFAKTNMGKPYSLFIQWLDVTSIVASLSLSLSLSHTHTHTHQKGQYYHQFGSLLLDTLHQSAQPTYYHASQEGTRKPGQAGTRASSCDFTTGWWRSHHVSTDSD